MKDPKSAVCAALAAAILAGCDPGGSEVYDLKQLAVGGTIDSAHALVLQTEYHGTCAGACDDERLDLLARNVFSVEMATNTPRHLLDLGRREDPLHYLRPFVYVDDSLPDDLLRVDARDGSKSRSADFLGLKPGTGSRSFVTASGRHVVVLAGPGAPAPRLSVRNAADGSLVRALDKRTLPYLLDEDAMVLHGLDSAATGADTLRSWAIDLATGQETAGGLAPVDGRTQDLTLPGKQRLLLYRSGGEYRTFPDRRPSLLSPFWSAKLLEEQPRGYDYFELDTASGEYLATTQANLISGNVKTNVVRNLGRLGVATVR